MLWFIINVSCTITVIYKGNADTTTTNILSSKYNRAIIATTTAVVTTITDYFK